MLKEIDQLLQEFEDEELDRLKKEIQQLLKEYYESKSHKSSHINHLQCDSRDATDKSHECAELKLPRTNSVSSSLPFGLGMEDFKYLEYDNNGKLVAFVTRPRKAGSFRKKEDGQNN